MSENDPKYPIYHTDVKWAQDGEFDEKYPKWYEGLPEGRMWDSTGFTKMFKEDPGQTMVLHNALDWWKYYTEEKLGDVNPGIPEIDIIGPRYETWCILWFSHYTFDDGRSDREFLDSFACYVLRYAHLQDYYPRDMPEGYLCLMGAEHRWRWHGANHDSPAPCRCEHCVKQGVVRIGH